jgi:hypothetical protein
MNGVMFCLCLPHSTATAVQIFKTTPPLTAGQCTLTACLAR